ncbi:MAG: adenylate/guanylate cyclase domain-containing protein [Leptospiraceae bacterium]|nr:adenylate/guanylate cyclase domain-containing protein [Leptospiraceae bacterium]
MLQLLWNTIAYSGVFHARSITEQKYIVLVNGLSIFCALFTGINLLTLSFFDTPRIITIVGIIYIISILFTLFLNSSGKTLIAKVYIVLLSYFYIVYNSLMIGNQAKNYLFLISISLIAYFIFLKKEKVWMNLAIFLSFITYILLEVIHESLNPIHVIPTEKLYMLNSIINISFGVLLLAFAYNVMNTYSKSELFAILEHEKSERLLKNILPTQVIKKLRETNDTIAERYENCTVLFADIVGFTDLSRTMSALEIVSILNVLFSAFDDLVEKYGLEKIKTIGDSYMVVGGIPEEDKLHAEKIASLALEMLEIAKSYSKERNVPLELRIGINSGEAVAGVIGKKKFIFDLWGNSVNLASRMESQGVPGQIQVTESTHDLLKDKFKFIERGIFNVKGIGGMKSYMLSEKLV